MSFFTYDPYDPKDKPERGARAWIVGIAWASVAILAFIGLMWVFIHIL